MILTNLQGHPYQINGKLLVQDSAVDPPPPPTTGTNPANYYIQTRGVNKSRFITNNTGAVLSVNANADESSKFITKRANWYEVEPTLVSSPDLVGTEVMYFDSSSQLELTSVLPASFLGNHARTFYLYVKTSGNANRNILGYGANGNSQCFDVLMYNSGSVASIHVYSSPAIAITPVIANQWQLMRFAYDGTGVVEISVDDLNTSYFWGSLNTVPIVSLRLGQGTFESFNGPGAGGWMYLAHFEAYDRLITGAGNVAEMQRIRAIYS